GSVGFWGSSSAGNASIGVSGSSPAGILSFSGSSTGDTAQIYLDSTDGYNSGAMFIDDHNAPGVLIGSLAGAELSVVSLGGNNLIVGSNSLNTTFSGSILGNTGSLTKTGSGKLTLTNANPYYSGSDYAGGTTIKKGVLI